jgi:hypothetical protein
VLDDPVDRRDDLRDIHGSVGGTDLQRDELGVRGHAHEAGTGGVATGDDPGHMGAVAVGVAPLQVRRLTLEREIRAVGDVAGGESVHGRDAGVDERDADALAGVAALGGDVGPGDPAYVRERRTGGGEGVVSDGGGRG